MTEAQALPLNAPQLVIQILLAVGTSSQQILHPVADTREALALMDKILKTTGFMVLARDSDAPIMFHVRHVVMVQVGLLPPTVRPPQIARIN